MLMLTINYLAFTQCTSPISTFPYVQDFEATNGGWTSGGTNSDWAYGTPNKTVIANAASGTKCWIVGGLTGNNYNNAENSWIQSPCFNISSLSNPLLSFIVFWETEKKYDGASFRYSLDGGLTWLTLGSASSNNNCIGSNWFNTNFVTTLGTDGWSGNIQPTSPCPNGAGNGSGAWVTAKHNLISLAGQTSVIFRFTFAAGTQCNAYDGFAIDDFGISEAVQNQVNYNYSCLGNYSVAFTNNSSLCATNYLWNFNDPNTGIDSISTQENPTHTFSTPGIYNVKLTVTYPGNVMLSTTQTVTIIGVNTNINSSILCNGNSTGSITANAFGGNGNYNYSWNTTPTQNTATINNLNAGSYTVNVTNTNACSISKTVVLNEPTALNANALIKPNICNNGNGSIQLTVAGGKTPYQFAWSNNASTNPVMNLATGNYTVTLTDSNACTLSLTNLIIKDSSNNIQIYLGKDTAFCPGNQLILNPGNFEHYEWQDLSKQPTFTVSQTGTYSVTVTDKDGCKAFDTIEITVDCKDVYFPTAFTPNGDGKNDFFGAIGNINALTFYQLFVYNRNGELIFSSSNSSKKWDGTIKGKKLDNGSYTWYASYSINNQPLQMQKGTIILIK
ncbi:MAG: gliding motility-associated C-terminal domain-containing protein [Chitinophagaceae bacterium]|nr:gliding motility-associated C-terminal domain-containing protein [Chitinophagaceae bacterium]